MLITLVYLCIYENMFHVFFYYLLNKCVYIFEMYLLIVLFSI
jgi:hypothetical protein